nr:serine/threonine-protein kinase D6PKL2 [Tanacetum cinerariifolium]
MKKLPLVGSTLPAVFAAKVMDMRELASRNKEGWSRTEREILEALDHSFLPRLYAAIETPKWTCLLTEFCSGGDLRRQKKKPKNQTGPQLVAEPVDARSMSFVGTHEYLTPEIVSGKGHGSVVDWWTLGIFMFELFYGVTPFRGMDNRLTLANIVARALEFPKEPAIPPMAKDLISQLLAKDLARRLRSTMGTSAIKHHSFFQGVNWALLRCAKPSFVPPPFNISSREALEFPKEPAIPPMAKDLISQLLAKDPARRLRSTMGASAIKHHSFF